MASFSSSEESLSSPRKYRTVSRRSATVFTTLFARKKCFQPGKQHATNQGDLSWMPRCVMLDME